jgi:hypothetical protein
MREVGARGIGALKGATVVVVAEEEWAVAGIELCASSCAGVAFLLFELEESRGVPRPKDRPTADAPTTVAVAQSCVTKMRQSLPPVRLEADVERSETGSQRCSEAAEALRHVKTKQGPVQSRHAVDADAASKPCRRKRGSIVTVGTVFILVRNHTAGEDSLGEALVTTRAFWHVKPQ